MPLRLAERGARLVLVARDAAVRERWITDEELDAALTLFEKDIEEFIDHTQIERGFSQNTSDGYLRDLTQYAAWLGSDIEVLAPMSLLAAVASIAVYVRRR